MRSRDHRPTVKHTIFRRFIAISYFFWNIIVAERSRDVVGGHEKWPRPTVKQRFLDVSSDLGNILKKVAERSRDSGRRSRDRRPTVKERIFRTFQAIWGNFEKSRWTVTQQWSEVTRPSADCQTTFFGRFKQLGKYFEKSRWTVTRQW